MADIKFECSDCNQRVSGDKSLAGTEVQCPACNRPFIVPLLQQQNFKEAKPIHPPFPAYQTHSAARSRTVSLKCTSCGAALDITPDLDTFSCAYCGHRLLVQRSGGTISLKTLEEAVSRVQHGTDRTASELAVRRLQDDVASAKHEIEKIEKNTLPQAEYSGCLIIATLFIGGVILCVTTDNVGFSVPTAVVTFIAICIDQRQSQARFRAYKDKLQQLWRWKVQQIEKEIQKHLVFLNKPNA